MTTNGGYYKKHLHRRKPSQKGLIKEDTIGPCLQTRKKKHIAKKENASHAETKAIDPLNVLIRIKAKHALQKSKKKSQTIKPNFDNSLKK